MSNLFQQEYEKLMWNRWAYRAGEFDSLKKASPSIPPKHGVYLFVAPHPLCRVKGESNIIYVGQSGGGKRRGYQGIGKGNGSPGRIFNRRGHDEVVREYIEGLFPEDNFLVECHFTRENEDPEKIESHLLSTYLKTHFELPPANHQFKEMNVPFAH